MGVFFPLLANTYVAVSGFVLLFLLVLLFPLTPAGLPIIISTTSKPSVFS